MTTQYIMVSRQTGELYDGHNIKRFYDTYTSADGQCGPLHLWTILEVELGANPKVWQVAKESITEKQFKDSIAEHLEEEQEHLDWCLERPDAKTDDWMQHLIQEDRDTIAMLKGLRYKDLLYK